MVKLLSLNKSYVNRSGMIHDSEFINLVNIEHDSIHFDDQTLFLNDKEKKELNETPLESFNNNVFVFNLGTRWGILANLPIEEYKNGNVKTHELVLPNVVQRMLSNLHSYNGEAAPVLLLHEGELSLPNFVSTYVSDEIIEFQGIKLYSYTGIASNTLLKMFERITPFYIGDGHHRLYTSSLSCFKNTVFSCIMEMKYMDILPIHRVMSDVSEENFQRSLAFLKNKFHVTIESKCESETGYILMHRNNVIYKIKLIDLKGDAFWNNDIYRLNTQIFSQAFRYFPEEDIKYISQSDLNLIANKNDDSVIFEVCELSKEEFKSVASNDTVLPPKTTWMYPKFPSFLVMNKYKE